MTVTLIESIAPVGSRSVGKKWRARILEGDRWGSSAYYPNDILKRDGPNIFKAGLQMFANHPSESESFDRPERNVNDLVGKLTSDAVFEEDGLYADVEFYDTFATRISEMHADVGLSVRAQGVTEEGEMAGRYGPIVTSILSAASVDVVTRAGAGGKLTSIIESDRSPAGRPIELQEGSHSVTDVTKEDFEAFSKTLTEAIAGIPAALAEALKPEPAGDPIVESDPAPAAAADEEVTPKDEVEVDAPAVLTAVAEAALPASVITNIYSDIKAGKTLEEAVKVQTDYRDALVESATGISGTVVKLTESTKATGLARSVEILGH